MKKIDIPVWIIFLVVMRLVGEWWCLVVFIFHIVNTSAVVLVIFSGRPSAPPGSGISPLPVFKCFIIDCS